MSKPAQRLFAAALLCLLSGVFQSAAAQNRMTLEFDCNLNGVTGRLVMNVEVIANTGVTLGPGARPDITGVIATGDQTILTSGALRSSYAHYVFRGRGAYADFSKMNAFERFRVRFQGFGDNRLRLIVNPHGRGPTAHDCLRRK